MVHKAPIHSAKALSLKVIVDETDQWYIIPLVVNVVQNVIWKSIGKGVRFVRQTWNKSFILLL